MDFFQNIPSFDNPLASTWWMFTHGGFILVLVVLGYGIWWVYMDYIQTEYIKKTKYVLLAVDVPKENEQTPKAVEHIFSHFHGIQKSPNAQQKYLDGYVQPTISVELISIDGYIQYLVRCPVSSRDLVEASIYAQYPNAEINEVEDYTNGYTNLFPNPDFNIWAGEIIFYNDDAYPIRTYPSWEHSLTQTFLDPMASLLEIMNRLQTGEQFWLQWVLSPAGGSDFRKKGLDVINKLIGAKAKKKVSKLEEIMNVPSNLVIGTWQTVTRTLFEPGESSPKKEDKGAPNQLQYLPPHMRAVVEAIGIKVSKLVFETKFRMVYMAKKDIFNGARIAGMMGALKQFGTMDMNGFKPHKSMKTSRDYWFVDTRVNALRRKLFRHYRQRSMMGGHPIMMNIEELASIWHFPVITVKAPSVQKMDAKRGEPPVSLPVGDYNPMPPPPTSSVSTPSNLPAT
jgi:hypothetical protein